jgi:hypothetical protein
VNQKPRPRLGLSIVLNIRIGLVFVVAGVILVLLVNRSMRQQALVEAESKALILLDRNLATRTYFSQIMKPRLFEWSASFRSDEYFEPSWMSSTYAVRQIDKYFKSLSPADYYIKDAAINARSPDNEANDYESAYLEELNANLESDPRSDVRILEGEPYLVVLRPGEIMEESCLRCHSHPDDAPADLVSTYGPDRSFSRTLGEVISTISIRVPLAEAYGKADRFSWQLCGLLGLLLLFLFVAQSLLYRRLLIVPLGVIRAQAHRIATTTEHLGEEIPAPRGRELGQLADAFNVMSVNLRRNRDQLESRVEERTSELTQANAQLGQEITKRKQAEGRLVEYSERLEETVEERTKQLRDAQEQLVRREKLAVLGQLAGGVGHELRNPLAVISSAVYYLKMIHSDGDETAIEYLDMISAEVHNSGQIITDLLDFARTRPPTREEISVSALVRAELERRPAPPNVQVITDIPARLPSLNADPAQIALVLGNLITNAYQAMPDGGKLTISARAEKDRVAIAMTDTGGGISAGNMEKLFEPLFTTKPRGVGLGLSTSRNLVEANGGSIDAESTEGEGATFTVRLPLNTPLA